ncbi:hypothetical protein E6W36_11810 [Hankyongella ginsenosidimutans]|uniref:Uncharacterized protein n=1 Tax=Hankyongella ginsenosidimutans TaxID=1763828 RepID=A0A4D7C7H6_9SPHN|nr:hypothetical protein [Hankyongella ginsenosidimutans]QCI79945.1 hypothetical protein E6W36_11810 [Hankyongella ginsenosidimutans]
MTELDIEDGAAITGAATSSLTASKIKVSSGSSIRLPGGTIGIDERLPEVFTVDNTLSIGIRNLSDILTPSVDDDGNTVYVEEDRLTQEAIDGLGDNTRGLSTQSSNIDVANSLNPLYFLGDLDSSVGLQIESGGIVDLSGASLRNPRARVNPFTQNLLRTGRIVSGGSLDIQYFTIGESFPDIFNFSDINQNLLVSGVSRVRRPATTALTAWRASQYWRKARCWISPAYRTPSTSWMPPGVMCPRVNGAPAAA